MPLMLLLNLILLAAHAGFAAWAWPHLPESIPAHFDASGQPTRWTRTSVGSWFGLVGVSAGIAALMGVLAWAAPRYPALLNIPNKDKMLALPPERQQPVLRRAMDLLWLINAPILLCFLLIQLGMWHGAHGGDPTGFTVGALVLAVLSTPLALALGLPRVQAELKRQLEAADP